MQKHKTEREGEEDKCLKEGKEATCFQIKKKFTFVEGLAKKKSYLNLFF